MFGNKLFQAEQAAFHYSELRRENISSVKEECTSFVITELRTVFSWTDLVNGQILYRLCLSFPCTKTYFIRTHPHECNILRVIFS